MILVEPKWGRDAAVLVVTLMVILAGSYWFAQQVRAQAERPETRSGIRLIQWEYDAISCSQGIRDCLARLNRAGADGWEVVTVHQTWHRVGSLDDQLFIMKRRK